MFSVHVERTIGKPIEAVWEILTDHANYHQFPGCDESHLLIHGENTRNGNGAIRDIRLGNVQFVEKIHGCKPPFEFHYKIEKAKPFSITHNLGVVTLKEVVNGTHVVWRSKGSVDNLWLGWMMDMWINTNGPAGFGAILKYIDKMPFPQENIYKKDDDNAAA